MWKSNLITALRVLARNRAITLINVIGLSAALAVTILCLLFVRYETSFDTWHEKGERIFAVYFESLEPDFRTRQESARRCAPGLAEALRTTVAGIRESVLMHRTYARVSLRRRGLPEDGPRRRSGLPQHVHPAAGRGRCGDSTRSSPQRCAGPRDGTEVLRPRCTSPRHAGGAHPHPGARLPQLRTVSTSTSRRSRWIARSREFWLHFQGLLFYLWTCSYPRRWSRNCSLCMTTTTSLVRNGYKRPVNRAGRGSGTCGDGSAAGSPGRPLPKPVNERPAPNCNPSLGPASLRKSDHLSALAPVPRSTATCWQGWPPWFSWSPPSTSSTSP